MLVDKHLFLGANTAEGLVHFFNNIIEMYDLKKLYILKGGSGIGKSTFIRKFTEAFKVNSKNPAINKITYIYCSGDPKSLDGAIIEDLCIGIIDGTSPHQIDPKYPGIIDETVNLGEFLIPKKVKATKQEIDIINAQKLRCYEKAFKELAKARTAHHSLEKLYKDAVDFKAINNLLNVILKRHAINSQLLKDSQPEQEV